MQVAVVVLAARVAVVEVARAEQVEVVEAVLAAVVLAEQAVEGVARAERAEVVGVVLAGQVVEEAEQVAVAAVLVAEVVEQVAEAAGLVAVVGHRELRHYGFVPSLQEMVGRAFMVGGREAVRFTSAAAACWCNKGGLRAAHRQVAGESPLKTTGDLTVRRSLLPRSDCSRNQLGYLAGSNGNEDLWTHNRSLPSAPFRNTNVLSTMTSSFLAFVR